MKTHDLGWLKRVDRGDGYSDLVDGFGSSVAVVETASVDRLCANLEVRRCRMTDLPGVPLDFSVADDIA
jgi:hypothetical protein